MNRTHIAILMDGSGSMSRVKQDTVGGINDFIKEQAALEGEATISITVFDTRYVSVCKAVTLDEVEPADEWYFTVGMTALLDSIGRMINETDDFLDYVRGTSKEPDKVIFVVVTDGLENSSKEFHKSQIQTMVESHQEKGWEFVFFGANMETIAEGQDLGFAETLSYSLDNMSETYGTVSARVVQTRTVPNEK